MILRRFFIWRAEKRLGRSQYRFDRRQYRGIFRPGFFAHLSSTKFWQTDNDPFLKKRRRRRKVTIVLVICFLFAIGWILYESSRALRLF
jgi:hypothetical protein